VDKAMLLRGLAMEIRGERSSSSGEWPYRAEVPEEQLRITVDGDEATVEAEALFRRRHQEEWHLVWQMRVQAELVRTEDGWRFTRSRHENVEGRGLR
jgi:hypothetical protein